MRLEDLTVRRDEQLSDLVDIFITHRSQLCHVAMRILGSQDRADDAVQDAYLKIIEADAVFAVKQPTAYVYRVVRNLAIDRYRRSSLELDVFAVAEEGRNVASSSGTPEAISISRQDLSLIARALGELPERTRRAFELYRIGGHTQREIAKLLDVSPTLVNFMIRDALAHCRATLNAGT